ncbi:orotidine-5'-phosphate decarboxylase [Candidatus Kaiserbacteria bacterium CG10_big_fil_rev_8_21_14_0_10_51_14]|uniref:Orotidine-5'-phosphate decarboxylase n=1 Tax=Candidatus Kaiserbacteria bacterium CG10_big_fil_rev_8_21_14_0_10_51_14 TaxID=1974610 RepID=A0A2H0UD67_9BACT|nr:MAG: orotidine-5'-phosphate decarboxylase [Candidatus Kaiserbacteria bacterium CG10_big_fil_rev_8_21_14_0_10_51_14]
MSERNFRALLEKKWEEGKFLCIGLDSEFEKIPEAARERSVRETIVGFNRAIVDATKDLVCAYKPNPAFYEVYGDEGWKALRETIQYILEAAPEVPVILDAKRGDIGNTNKGYAESAFTHLRVDAITVHPYFGSEALSEFFEWTEKGIIVLCKSSNSGSGEIQNLKVDGTSIGQSASEPLYKLIARLIAGAWNAKGNACIMVGATYPEELAEVREIVGGMPILIPGIGAQNGDIEKTVQAGKDARGRGMIISAARAVIFASSGADFAKAASEKARELDSAIRKAL